MHTQALLEESLAVEEQQPRGWKEEEEIRIRMEKKRNMAAMKKGMTGVNYAGYMKGTAISNIKR